MKKLIFSVLVMVLAVTINAQEIPERKSDRPHLMERNRHPQGREFQKLNLTDDQKQKFKSQKESFHKQMEELKKNDNITVKEWRSKAENLRKDFKQGISGIMTQEQKAQLEKWKAEGKEKFANMAKERGARMKTELGLTEEQSAKMRSNRQEMAEKMKAIRENSSMGMEQKREQMKEMMKKQKEYLKTVLTDEQLKKFKEMRDKRPEGERKRPEIKKTI